MLRGFTPDHQQWLKKSTALVAGVGGLGGTAALYLAAAGIGRLVLVHAGNLTLSNMNRQILMKHSGIGKSRVLQAKARVPPPCSLRSSPPALGIVLQHAFSPLWRSPCGAAPVVRQIAMA